MSTDRPNPSHLQRQRVPLESKVSLKFKEFRGFITEYSQNISLGGMFLATDRPQPPGTVFDFEFKLADEFSLIHGIGEVVWARSESQDPEAPAGMGVRFLHIDGAGEKLVRRMVRE
ncbi:MAG: TIGR02266 family protein, partial [Thermoanaerobaculia bacterium]|nr:TIGR02266 family protein [Thermoanaerobaculia bacterium]